MWRRCTGDNIFIIKGRDPLHPGHVHGALKGITRDVAMELAARIGLEVREELLTRYDLCGGRVFPDGDSGGGNPRGEIDGRKIGTGAPGPYTWELVKLYREKAMSEGTPIYDE